METEGWRCLRLRLLTSCLAQGVNVTSRNSLVCKRQTSLFVPHSCFPQVTLDFGTVESALQRLRDTWTDTSETVLVLNTTAVIILIFNIIGLLTYRRMKRFGHEPPGAQVLLLRSDVASLLVGSLWYLPTTELFALDRLDLFCHRWILGALLRLGITVTGTTVLAGQGFLLAVTVERLRAIRRPVAFMTRDEAAEQRRTLALVISLSLLVAGGSQFELARYNEPRLRDLTPQSSACLLGQVDTVLRCASSENASLAYQDRYALSLHTNRLCDWHKANPLGDESYALSFALSQVLLSVFGGWLLKVFAKRRQAKRGSPGAKALGGANRTLTVVILATCFLSFLQFLSFLLYAVCDLTPRDNGCHRLTRWAFLATLGQLSSNLAFTLLFSRAFRRHYAAVLRGPSAKPTSVQPIHKHSIARL